MEKTDYSQLELFSQGRGRVQTKTRLPGALSCILRYEKAVLTIICFIIMGVVSFSLGVEKGKRIAARKNNLDIDMAKEITVEQTIVSGRDGSQGQPQKQDPAVKPESVPNVKEHGALAFKEEKTVAAPKDALQRYTIQLVTYQTKRYAQKEAQLLEKKGFVPVILSSGRYNILCVGEFPDRESAKSLLSKLKINYKDCLIRRL